MKKINSNLNITFIIICTVIIIIILFFASQYLMKINKESFRGGGGGGGHGGGGGGHSGVASHATSSHSSNGSSVPTKSSAQAGASTPRKNKCFSKDSSLHLEDGSSMQINTAKIGDKILSYSLTENKFKYSPIISIPHEKNNISSQFIEITTSSGKKIKMTKDHLIPIISEGSSDMKLIKAENINTNDVILTVDGCETVSSKEVITEDGIYTVITMDDYIVVNNIVVSPFAISHLVSNFYYQFHRTLYNISPSIIESSYFNTFNKNNVNLFNNIYETLVEC